MPSLQTMMQKALKWRTSGGQATGGTGIFTFSPIERALRTGHAYLDNLYDASLEQDEYMELGITTATDHASVLREIEVSCTNELVELRLYEDATYVEAGTGKQTNMNRNEAATHPSVVDVTDRPTVSVQGVPILVQVYNGQDSFNADPLVHAHFTWPIALKDDTQYILRLTHLGASTGTASVTILRCECPYE